MVHLVDGGQDRENLAVDRIVTIMPVVHGRWYQSLGLHPQRHWALLRPKFPQLHTSYPETEIDMVLGPVATSGQLSLDELTAVEAKCWSRTWSDIEEWRANAPHPKSSLWNQVRRNSKIGFTRVAVLSRWHGISSKDRTRKRFLSIPVPTESARTDQELGVTELVSAAS